MRTGSPPRGLSLETVLESTTDSVFVLDRDWRFAYLNGRARGQIARGRDLAGAVIWDAFPEARATPFWAAYHKAMDEGVPASCEAFFRPLQGWFEANAYPIEDGVAVFFRDISERKRAEEERETLLARLEYEHTLLDAIVRQLPVGVLVAEAPGGRILLHNDAAAELLGHPVGPVEDLAGYSRFSAVHPDGSPYAPEEFPIVRALTAGEEVDREPMLYRREDGGLAHLSASARPVREGGRIVAAVGAFDDVTELWEAIERHRLALTAANMGDWSWDAATDLMSFSDRALEIFGFNAGEEVTRTRLRTYCDPGDLARAEATIEDAAHRRTRYRVEYRYRRPYDGVERWLLTMGHATSRPDGTLAGITGVVLDVTARKRAEEQQELLVRELHHRVKNTLATVQAIVGATARSAPSPEHFAAAFTGRVISLAKTHDLLTEGAWQTASLREMLSRELHPYEDHGRSRVALDGPPVELATEEAVPLGMAIHELTTNAAKYGALSRSGGRLSVTWSLDGPEAPGGGPTLRLSWVERGGPPVAEPKKLGFGSRLLNRVLTAQLQADVETRFPPEGFELSLAAPVRGRAAALPVPGA